MGVLVSLNRRLTVRCAILNSVNTQKQTPETGLSPFAMSSKSSFSQYGSRFIIVISVWVISARQWTQMDEWHAGLVLFVMAAQQRWLFVLHEHTRHRHAMSVRHQLFYGYVLRNSPVCH